MKVTIGASVGRGGENRAEDVGKVQTLLNATGLNPPLEVTCEAGSETIKAITDFQYRHTLEPDGRIDPDGPTLRALNRAYKVGDMPVPDHTLVKLLGYGAFGEVWMAQTSSGVKKALKLIPLDRGSGWKEFKGVFRVRDIRNPCLVSITDVWLLDTEGKVLGREDVDQLIKDASSSLFGRGTIAIPLTKPKVLVVAMQLCDQSLYNVLEESRGKGIPKDKLLRFMEDAARGLDYLNSRQHQFSFTGGRDRDSNEMVAIRHCDVKPENIMVVGGCAQVCDFGLAQIARAGGVRKRTGQLHASIYYAAPEMLDEDGVPTETTDQYSLALTYYHLRTGDLPFRPEDRNSLPALLEAHTRGRLDLSKLPERERKVIQKATSLNPKKRYKTCGEMVRDLKLGPQMPIWKDLRIAVPVTAMLLSILVAVVVYANFPASGEGLWRSASADWNEAKENWQVQEASTISLDELLTDYRQILADCRDALGKCDTLATLASYRERASGLKSDVLSYRKSVIARMRDDAAARFRQIHARTPDPVEHHNLDLFLEALRKESNDDPSIQREAQLLLLRHRGRRLIESGSRSTEIDQQFQKLKKELLADSPADAFSPGKANHLLLETLLFLEANPRPSEIEALGKKDDDLRRLLHMLPDLGRLSEMDRELSASEEWASTWEYAQLNNVRDAIHHYLTNHSSPWADGRLTEELAEQIESTFWRDERGTALLPTLFEQRIQDAIFNRKRGDYERATTFLHEARDNLDETTDPNAKAQIEVLQLSIWLASPDQFRDDLLNREHPLSLMAPEPRYETWMAACESLEEAERNALVEGIRTECTFEAGDNATFDASQVEGSTTWYSDYVAYIAALAAHRQGMHAAAAELSVQACAALPADGAAGETSLVAAPHRLRQITVNLATAAEDELIRSLWEEAPSDGALRVGPAQLGKLFELPQERIDQVKQYLTTIGKLSVPQPLMEDVVRLCRLVVAFARATSAGSADDWKHAADTAEEITSASSLANDRPDWQPLVRTIAAESRRHCEGIVIDERHKIVAHYASALGGLSLPVSETHRDSLLPLYQRVIEPAVTEARLLAKMQSGASISDEVRQSFREAVAVILRWQGMTIRNDSEVSRHLRREALKSTNREAASPTRIAYDALRFANSVEPVVESLLEEAYALISVEGIGKEQLARLEVLAKLAEGHSTGDHHRIAVHRLRAFVQIAMARRLPIASAATHFQAALVHLDAAAALAEDGSRNMARVLVGRSTARLEFVNARKPDRKEWIEQLNSARADAQAAVSIAGEWDPIPASRAWIALGNAHEDLALFCDSDVETNYTEAIRCFKKAAEAMPQLRESQQLFHAYYSTAHCRMRFRQWAQRSGRDIGAAEPELARSEIDAALKQLNAVQDEVNPYEFKTWTARAFYWRSVSHGLESDPSIDEQLVDLNRAVQAASRTFLWPEYSLEWMELAHKEGRSAEVTRFTSEFLVEANKQGVAEEWIRMAFSLWMLSASDPYEVTGGLSDVWGRLSSQSKADLIAGRMIETVSSAALRSFKGGLPARFSEDVSDLDDLGATLADPVSPTLRAKINVAKAGADLASGVISQDAKRVLDAVEDFDGIRKALDDLTNSLRASRARTASERKAVRDLLHMKRLFVFGTGLLYLTIPDETRKVDLEEWADDAIDSIPDMFAGERQILQAFCKAVGMSGF